MPVYEQTIDGVVKDWQHRSMNVDLVINGRDSWRCEIGSIARQYVPLVGKDSFLEEDGNLLVDGFLDSIDEQGAGNEPILDALYRLTFVGQDVLASRRIVTETYAVGTSLKAIVDDLVANYLAVSPYNVTADSGNPTTPVLTEELIIKNTVLTEVLDNLATWAGGLIWSIKNRVLSFKTLAVIPSPFDIADSDNPANTVGEIRKRISKKNKKNIVIVTGGTPGYVDYVQQFVGDGTTDTFQLDYAIYGHIPPTAPFDGSVGYSVVEYGIFGTSFNGNESLAGINAPVGFIWEYDHTTFQITRRLGPVANGVDFYIRYQRETPITVSAIDAADVAANGPNEIRLDFPGIIVQAELQRIADTKLAEFLGDLEEVTYRTHNAGIRVGMVQSIQNAHRDINGSFLVTEVHGRTFEGIMEWTVTAVGGSKFRGSFRDLYAAWLRFGGGGTAQSSVTIPPGGAGAAGPGLPFKSLQWNRAGAFAGTEAANGGVIWEDVSPTFSGFGELRFYPTADPTKYTRLGIVNTNGDFEQFSKGSMQLSADQDLYLLGGINGSGGIVSVQATEGITLAPGSVGAAGAYTGLKNLALLEGVIGKFIEVSSNHTIHTTSPSDTNELLTFFCTATLTLTLPPLAGNRTFPATSFRRIFCVVNTSSSGTVTLAGNSGSELVNGVASITIGPGGAVWVQGHSTTNWRVTAGFGSVSGGSSTAPLKATVTLTDTQIKALPSTAVNLIAAPGAGKIIVPVSATVVTDFSSGNYTNVSTGDGWMFISHNTNHIWAYFAVNDTMVGIDDLDAWATTAKLYTELVPWQRTDNVNAWYMLGKWYVQDANLVNAPLTIKADNQGTGNFTGGHANNIMRFVIYYTIEDAT